MSGLRILMFTTFYPPYSFGGDAVGVQRMARALIARGHQVTVVHDEDAYAVLGGKPAPDGDAADGVERIGLRAGAPFWSTLATQQLGRPSFHRKAIEAIVDRGWDIIWYNNISLAGGPGLISYGDALKVYEAHEHWLVCPMHVLWRYQRELCDGRECLRCTLSYRRPPQLWRYSGLLDRQLDKVDLLIAKSDFSRRKHAEFGLRQDMTALPYFLPDLPEATDDAPPPQDRPYFLFVGRLEKIKGVQDILPAFEGPGDADLLIAGDGEYREELERIAAGNPRVKFLGRMPLEALNALYRHAVALIVPSICYETFGIILIEAFRLGTPVIARRLGPFPEIVERAGAGRLFETADDLRLAMDEMAASPQVRQDFSDRARRGFLENWEEQRVLTAFGAALAAVARKAGRGDLAQRLEAGAFEGYTPEAQT